MKKLISVAVLSLLVAVGATAGEKGTTVGEKGTPAEAKALLDKAVTLVQTEGDAKALATFNDPKGGYQDRDLYVFCFGPDNKVTANVDQSLIGTDETSIKDADGKAIGKEMMAIGKKGEGNLEYKWKNPVSQKVETKVSYLKKAGTQVCGVGAYR